MADRRVDQASSLLPVRKPSDPGSAPRCPPITPCFAAIRKPAPYRPTASRFAGSPLVVLPRVGQRRAGWLRPAIAAPWPTVSAMCACGAMAGV